VNQTKAQKTWNENQIQLLFIKKTIPCCYPSLTQLLAGSKNSCGISKHPPSTWLKINPFRNPPPGRQAVYSEYFIGSLQTQIDEYPAFLLAMS
jgi:hypothetical protein